MKVLIAPDSFKGTFSSAEVIAAISDGVREQGAQPLALPVADGGEGTYEALCTALTAEPIEVSVRNPWLLPIQASFALCPDGRAIVEVAQSSGLGVSHTGPRDPITANTYGTGQLIAAAVAHGAKEIIVAAGGSATTDGGKGAVDAIHDAGGLGNSRITVLSDVRTTFVDAARVFAPQKGAHPGAVELLRSRLEEQAATYPKDPRDQPGSGAAGGLAGGLWAHYDAEIVSGAAYVLDAIGFDEKLRQADVVVVGEGRLDSQTGQGKIIEEILGRVRHMDHPVPVVAVVGSLSDDLGSYVENFADVIIAGDAASMRRAGQQLAAFNRGKSRLSS